MDKTYIKLMYRNDIHNDFQYKTGLNELSENEEWNPEGDCESGGFYFTDIENMLDWLLPCHVSIREVTIPEDAKIITYSNKYKVNKFILGEPMYLNDIKTLEWLINMGLNVNSILIYASMRGYVNIVEKLIKIGADVNAKNEYGMTPLMSASNYGYTEIVKLLKQHGANK